MRNTQKDYQVVLNLQCYFKNQHKQIHIKYHQQKASITILIPNTFFKNNEISKYLTYVLTFMAYAAVHILRMSYSAVKPYLEKTFQLDSIFLGLFDGLVYISLGMGFFFRFLIEGKTAKTKIYLIFGFLTAIGFSVIPIMGLALKNDEGVTGEQPFVIQYLIPGLALIVFGFCQFSAWPVLLYLVNQHFNVQTEGTILGIWSANGDVGNILGFFLASLIRDQIKIDWQYTMLIGASIHFVISILVFLILKDKALKKDQLLSEETTEVEITRMQKWKIFLKFSLQIIKPHENKMYLLSMGLLKSILYGFLLWMPTYLTHQGYSNYSTYAPIIFNAATVFGSALLGYFYKQKERVTNSQYEELSNCSKCIVMFNKNVKSYSLFYSCIIICACLVLFFSLTFQITLCLVLSGITGFFLGGAFNMLASNEVMAITKGDEQKVDMLSTLSMFSGNIFVGIVQIIIGLALNVKKDYSKQTNLFIVLLSICGFTSIIIFVRSTIIYRHRRDQSILLQNQIDNPSAK